MRNLLALLAFVVLLFAGLGWYFNWYEVHSAPAANGKNDFRIQIDSTKILEDVHKGVRKSEQGLQSILRAREEAAAATK
jgi:zona occludens toxin (predicted ATPase)